MKYCIELLYEHDMLECKPITTLLETNLVVNSDDSIKNYDILLNVTEFRKLISKLIYLTINRPSISYVVQVLSQFMHKPRKSHLIIVFRLLRT